MCRAELRQLGIRRLSTDEINDRHLVDGERHLFAIIGAEIQESVDQVLVLIAVKDDRAAFALAVGKDEGGALGGERNRGGAGHQCN